MDRKFILSCESTIDLPYSYTVERELPVLFYSYQVDGQVYEDDMGRDPEALNRFYDLLDAGKLPTTSQINTYTYYLFFKELLKQGDVLHIAFGSGMSSSVQNAMEAAEMLKDDFPDQRCLVIDSKCSSSGYGLLVDYAADLRDAGKSLEETAQWVQANLPDVHHQFFSTQLNFYRRSGRMSGSQAMLGTVLNICPIMRLDDAGHILAYDKVRGKKNAIQRTINVMKRHARGGTDYSGKCFICHSHCPEIAVELRDAVQDVFPNLEGKIRICDIGTIIAAHCGPGTVAVFYLGDARVPDGNMV